MSTVATDNKATASAHLGATLRSVMVTPTTGFETAVKITARRERAGAHPAEGWSPYVLSALGGAAVFLLGLKIAALLNLREDSAASFRWSYLAASAVLGAFLGLASQVTWSALGGRIVGLLGGRTTGRDVRLVWGASAFPQVFALLLLVPLDLLIAGPHSFTNARLEDPLATIWSSLSVALGVALVVWSLILFVKGLQVVGALQVARAAAAAASAVACMGLLLVALRFAAVTLAGGG